MKCWIWAVGFSVLLGFVADLASAQTGAASDGPWSGWAQCVLTGQFSGQGQTYFHEQTHTWQLTSSTPGPTSSAAIKQYAATWQVMGHGTRQRGQGNNSEQWTTAGQPMPDTITIRLTAEGTVRFGGAAQLRSVGTTTGAAIPYVDEWTFPVIEGAATLTSITGSAPQGVSANFTGAPPGTISTATCSWNFVRGGAAPQAPPQQLGLKPPAPIEIATVAGTSQPGTTTATPAGIMTATVGGTTSGATTSGTTTSSKDTTLRQEVVSSGANSVVNLLQGPAPMNVRAAAGMFTSYFGNFDPICIQKIGVSWDPVPGATGYNVYIDGVSWGRAAAGATSLQIDYPMPYIGLQTSGSSVTSRATVGALFDNRLEGVSTPVSFTHMDKC